MVAARHGVRALLAVLAVKNLIAVAGQGLFSIMRPAGQPRVTTPSGQVLGRWVPAERGGARFAAYLGIPYALPPVGDLRYKNPRPAAPWNGTLDATKDPPMCPQINEQGLTGQEDCLYLNVYVADRFMPWPSLPVLVLVHGGDFETGSGRLDFLGPHFLLNNGVIVASVNYRQGPLGYLSLDTELIPGNAGLKDVALALSWLQQNVAAFGGNPQRMTAIGFGTGATAVQILSIFPQTRDLFSRSVLLSGHAISPRAYTERHVERAHFLAGLLGAPDNSTETVTTTLREASVQDLLRANNDPRMRALGLPRPSPERRASQGPEAKLITQDPESILRQPKTPPMPILLGVDGREGTFPYAKYGLRSRSPAELDEMLPRLLPHDLLPGLDTAIMLGLGADPGPGPGPLKPDSALRLAQLVRDAYSGGGPIANNQTIFLDFLDDAFTYASTTRVAEFMRVVSTDAAPLYFYNFQVDDAYNYAKKLLDITNPGASHLDDLGYIVRKDQNPNLNQDLRGTGVAPSSLQFTTKVVTDFTKGIHPNNWPRVSPVPNSARSVLFIGPGLNRTVQFPITAANQDAFWQSVYRDLRSTNSTIGRKLTFN